MINKTTPITENGLEAIGFKQLKTLSYAQNINGYFVEIRNNVDSSWEIIIIDSPKDLYLPMKFNNIEAISKIVGWIKNNLIHAMDRSLATLFLFHKDELEAYIDSSL